MVESHHNHIISHAMVLGPDPNHLITFFLSLSSFRSPSPNSHYTFLLTFCTMADSPLPPTQSPNLLNTTPCLDHLPRDPGPKFNIQIIVAAMLCALVCALGLNSMLRCVFRCTQRAVTEPVDWVNARRANTGLKKKDMVALPTSTYAKNSSSPLPTAAASCAICLADFCDGDKIRVLPECEHRFHVGCIDKWLLSHSSCPTCRHQLKSRNCLTCLQIVTAP